MVGLVRGSLAVTLILFNSLNTYADCSDVENIIDRKDLPHINLSDVMSEAIKTHPRVYGAELDYQNALDQIKIARSARFPQIDFIMDAGRTKNPTYMPFAGTLETQQAGFNLNLLLTDFGVTKNQIRASHERAEAAQLSIQDQKTLVALSSVEAFVAVLRERLSLDLALKAYNDHVELKTTVSSVGSEAEVNVVVSRKQQVCDTVNSLLQEHVAAKNFYQAILNYDPENLYLVEPQKALVETDPAKSLELAIENHPAFAINNHNVSAMQAELEATRKSRRPRISLQAGNHDFDRTSAEFGPLELNGDYVGVRLSVPVARGGQLRARERQAERNEIKTRLERETLVRNVRQQVNTLSQSLKLTEYRIAELESVVVSSQSNIEWMKKNLIKKNSEGKDAVDRQVLINLLDERARLYKAELELNNQKMSLVLDSYNLLGQQGLLL